MRTAIIGSENFTDYQKFCNCLDLFKDEIKVIISGNTKGTDAMARRYARENNIPFELYEHDYSNGFMLSTGIVVKASKVLAFWDGVSCKTKNTLMYAKQIARDVEVIPI